MSFQSKIDPEALSNNTALVYNTLAESSEEKKNIFGVQDLEESKVVFDKMMKKLRPKDRVIKKDLENLCAKKLA